MFASLRLRQANLATIVEWIEIHFDIYIYHHNHDKDYIILAPKGP